MDEHFRRGELIKFAGIGIVCLELQTGERMDHVATFREGTTGRVSLLNLSVFELEGSGGNERANEEDITREARRRNRAISQFRVQ